MTRILWTIAFLAVAVGVARAQTYPAADVRWKLRIHVFFDSGLEFVETPETFISEDICYVIGDKLAARYKETAVAYCWPVHFILDDHGGRYT